MSEANLDRFIARIKARRPKMLFGYPSALAFIARHAECRGVRLDNLIMIAHNVHVGAHTAIAACTGIAGSTRIGRYCRIGGAVGISGHLTITDHVDIAGKTLITKSINDAGSYSGGYPFEETRAWRRNAIQIRHLDEMARHIKQLEKRLALLERKDP